MQYDDLTSVDLAQLKSARSWQQQFKLIVNWGDLVQRKAWLRQDQYLVKGCETQAWLNIEMKDSRCRFLFDSDSRIINGLVCVLLSEMDNKTPAQIAQIDYSKLLTQVGFESRLTPSRSNGIRAILMRAWQACAIASPLI